MNKDLIRKRSSYKLKEIEPESEMVQEVIEAINYFKTLREQLVNKIN